MLLFTLPVLIEWVAAALIVLLLTYTVYRWRHDPFFKTDRSYTMPIFGQIARLGRGRNIDRRVDENGLTPAEIQLMSEYRASIGAVDPITFYRNLEFLKITRQDSRKDAPILAFPLLFLLLIAEAFGFGLLLAPFISREVTPNDAPLIALVIAFVAAAVAAGLTHGAGQQIYGRRLIEDMRASARNAGVSPHETRVGPSENQKIDQEGKDGKVNHDATRFGNRILDNDHQKAPTFWIWVAIAFIIFIGAGSAVLRYENLNESLTRSVAASASTTNATDPFATGTTSSDLAGMPPAVVQNAKAAQHQVNVVLHGEEMVGGLAGIFILTAIFVFTQMYSTGIGMNYGKLSNKNVASAAYVTGGFSSYELYRTHSLIPKLATVEARLRKLRKKMYREHSRPEGQSIISFKQWLDNDPDKHRRYDVDDPMPEQKLGQGRQFHSPTTEPARTAPAPRTIDVVALAGEVLALPQADRAARLVKLKGELGTETMNELRDAINLEKERRARAETEPEDWMKEV